MTAIKTFSAIGPFFHQPNYNKEGRISSIDSYRALARNLLMVFLAVVFLEGCGTNATRATRHTFGRVVVQDLSVASVTLAENSAAEVNNPGQETVQDLPPLPSPTPPTPRICWDGQSAIDDQCSPFSLEVSIMPGSYGLNFGLNAWHFAYWSGYILVAYSTGGPVTWLPTNGMSYYEGQSVSEGTFIGYSQYAPNATRTFDITGPNPNTQYFFAIFAASAEFLYSENSLREIAATSPIEYPEEPVGCDGMRNSGAVLDLCNVCGGNNSCLGCDGMPNSGLVYDSCGVCGGNNSCLGCDGMPYSGLVYDSCGVCGGNNSCLGCDGTPNSGLVYDSCGVCGGNNSCLGCDGTPNSGLVYDNCGVCGGNNSCLGCDGTPNSGLVYDNCGVCGGNNSCLGCDGTPNSGLVYDNCGVCGGNNSCLGCDGMPNSGLVYDRCNICGGDGTSCAEPPEDEDGDTDASDEDEPTIFTICIRPTIQKGAVSAQIKQQGIFGALRSLNEENILLEKQANEFYGNSQAARLLRIKVIPKIKVFPKGVTLAKWLVAERPDCDMVVYPLSEWEKLRDQFPTLKSRVYRNLKDTKVDIAVVYNQQQLRNLIDVSKDVASQVAQLLGRWAAPVMSLILSSTELIKDFVIDIIVTQFVDELGKAIKERLAFVAGCDGVPGSGKELDVCGVCDGDGTSCMGCDGALFSGMVVDLCGVCGGNNTECAGCDGVPNSGMVVDLCGVCGGNNSTCLGCDGVPYSGKIYDACGVCGGNNTECAGCDGVPYSGMMFDACGVCGGNNTQCAGCDGVPYSGKIYDACGVCGGNNTECAGCDGVPNSGMTFDACGVCGGNNTQCVGCDGVPNSGMALDACGVCGGNGTSCMNSSGV